MKTFKNLYPKIYAFATLETAFHKARRGKRSDTWGLRRALLRPPIPVVPKTCHSEPSSARNPSPGPTRKISRSEDSARNDS